MAKTKQQLLVENQTSFPNNTTNYITPAILRDFNVDMIQSMVDEIPFGEYTQSVDTSIEALNNFTASAAGLSTGSLLVTASVVSNVLTFTKGDSSQFSLTVATGSGGGADITQLNQATASLQAFTASAQTSINALNTTTQSLQAQLTTIGGQSGSWGGGQVTSASFNQFTASVNTTTASLNSATASLFSSASLSLTTASVAGQILQFRKGDATTFNLTIPTGSGTIVTGSYAQFYDDATQSGSANTAYALRFPHIAVPDGVLLSGSTGMQVGAAGIYNIQFSIQVAQGASAANLNVWFKKNGVNISNSDTSWTVPSNHKLVPVVNILDQAALNDVYEIWWQSDSANTTFAAFPASGSAPAIPSVITTIYRVDVGGGTNVVTTGSFNAYTASVNATTQSLQTQLATIGTQSGSWGGGGSASWPVSGTPNGIVSSSAQITKLGFATTGSNGFFGNQNFNGNILVSGSVSLLSEGGNGWAFQSKALFLSNSVQTGLTVESPIHFYKMTKGNMFMTLNNGDPGSSGSMHITVCNDQSLEVSASVLNTYQPLNIYNPSPGITIAKNNSLFGAPYNISNAYVDVQTDPTNVFSAITVLDDRNNGNQIGIALNSYAVYPTATPMIYGGQFYSGTGTDCAMALPDDRIELWKPTGFKADLDASGSINVHSGSYNGKAINNITPVSSSKAPVQNIVTLSAAEYALITPNSTTLYIVI